MSQMHQTKSEPIKYGDVFNVAGELADKPIAPRDAATAEAVENQVLGKTIKRGVAAKMQSAASKNEKEGFVSRDAAISLPGDEDVVVVTKRKEGDQVVVTEAIGDKVLGQYVEPEVPMTTPSRAAERSGMTIGAALEAATRADIGDKPVDESDAAAIEAAEMRATESNVIEPGGLAATAQSAAAHNAHAGADEKKITLRDILYDARARLAADKAVNHEDAERVIEAEVRNKPEMRPTPGGVAESMAAAARANRNPTI